MDVLATGRKHNAVDSLYLIAVNVCFTVCTYMYLVLHESKIISLN
jgi:hypothetical protein